MRQTIFKDHEVCKEKKMLQKMFAALIELMLH